MTTFPLSAGPYEYRPLKKGLSGFDIYGLQRCLLGARYDLPMWGSDGQFGSETDAAVRQFQKDSNIAVDGIAGIVTQRTLVLGFCRKLTIAQILPDGLIMGQVEQESGYEVGNYTAPYQGGTRDLGLVQKNTVPTDLNCFKWFDGPRALTFLASDPERGLRPRHDRYYGHLNRQGKAVVTTHKFAWQLAAGSWHQPSIADAVARGERPMTDHLQEYIDKVCKYVTLWD